VAVAIFHRAFAGEIFGQPDAPGKIRVVAVDARIDDADGDAFTPVAQLLPDLVCTDNRHRGIQHCVDRFIEPDIFHAFQLGQGVDLVGIHSRGSRGNDAVVLGHIDSGDGPCVGGESLPAPACLELDNHRHRLAATSGRLDQVPGAGGQFVIFVRGHWFSPCRLGYTCYQM
jgi:hypothetical protein